MYFYFPETSGLSLEELTFIFEDKALADRAAVAVEKVVHHEGMPEKVAAAATTVEKSGV